MGNSVVITPVRLAVTEAEATHKYPCKGRQFGKHSNMRFIVAPDDWAAYEVMQQRSESFGWGSMFRRSARGGWKCCADYARNPPPRPLVETKEEFIDRVMPLEGKP